MIAATLVYNGLLAAAGAAHLRVLRRTPQWTVAAAGILLGGIVASLGAPVVALFFGRGFFGAFRLLAWGVFLHGPLVLALTAFVLRRSRAGAGVFGGLALLVAAVGADAFLIEPHRLQVETVRVEAPGLERPVRIGVLADLQTDAIGRHEARALRALMAAKPDLILLPGDFLQAPRREQPALREALRDLWRRENVSAPLGVFAVQGDVDPDDWTAIFEALPVTALKATTTVRTGPLVLTGLSFRDGGNPRLSVPAADVFHVAFAHRPEFALGDVKADLLVAGHTHGGQVRLPGIGPLVTLSAIPRAWAAGATALPGGRTLVVSRGVGMERGEAPRLRFLCPPQVLVLELVPR